MVITWLFFVSLQYEYYKLFSSYTSTLLLLVISLTLYLLFPSFDMIIGPICTAIHNY